MAQKARAIEKKLTDIMLFLGAVALAIATILIFVQVIQRYFFLVSYPWMEEVCRYLVVFTGFTVIGSVIFKNGDITLEFVANMIKNKQIKWLLTVINIIVTGIVATLILIWGVLVWIDAAGQLTMSLLFPLRLAYALLPFGMACLVVYCVLKLIILFGEGTTYFDHASSDDVTDAMATN